MNNTHKPVRNNMGSYKYRGHHIIRGYNCFDEPIAKFTVQVDRTPSGINCYRTFKTLKAAVAYIDQHEATK